MREQIERKINDWQQGVEQYTARRAKLLSQLEEINTIILRNQGAIAGAQELLEQLDAPAPVAVPALPPEPVLALEGNGNA